MRTATLAFRFVPIFIFLFFPFGQAKQAASHVAPADAAKAKEEIQKLQALLPTLPDRGPALFVIADDHATWETWLRHSHG